MALTLGSLSAEQFDELVGLVTVDRRVNQINQMVAPVLDRTRPNGSVGDLAEALPTGTTVDFDGVRWVVSAQSRRYLTGGIELTVEMLSGLGATLKNDRGPRDEQNVTPKQWIDRRVKAAGGRAAVQPGAKQRQISQKRGVSALKVIEDLASEMGTSWCDVDNVLYVGTPWWAFEGGPGLPVWDMPLRADVVHAFDARTSLVDDANSATATMTIPNDLARTLRPWFRFKVSRAAGPDNGLWLVDSVQHDLADAPGTVELSRPLRSAVIKGSSSKAGVGDSIDGDYTIPEDGWVPGADKVWRLCNKTPRAIVAQALRDAAAGKFWGTSKCLNYVSHVCTGSPPSYGAAGGHGGAYARYVWDNKPPGTPHGSDRNAPAGSLVVWRHNSVGHIAIAVGNGKMVTTSNGPVRLMGIGDYMGWGGYAGWMAPNFYT